jgi:GNAT superfamily N-acetyltransferase
MDISIQIAQITDLPMVLKLYHDVLDKNKKVLSVNEAEILFNKFSKYPDYHLYIALLDGEIIGSFALLIMDNLAHFGSPSAIVEDVVVAENFQNKGVGKIMMEFAISKAKQAGCYKMVLSSNQKRVDAHRFYEGLGFEKHGFSFMVKF